MSFLSCNTKGKKIVHILATESRLACNFAESTSQLSINFKTTID